MHMHWDVIIAITCMVAGGAIVLTMDESNWRSKQTLLPLCVVLLDAGAVAAVARSSLLTVLIVIAIAVPMAVGATIWHILLRGVMPDD